MTICCIGVAKSCIWNTLNGLRIIYHGGNCWLDCGCSGGEGEE